MLFKHDYVPFKCATRFKIRHCAQQVLSGKIRDASFKNGIKKKVKGMQQGSASRVCLQSRRLFVFLEVFLNSVH